MALCIDRAPVIQPASSLASFSLATALSRLYYHQGEQRLMLAVLVDAIGCVEHYGTRQGARNWGDCCAALRWISSNDQQWPFSFENICAALGLNPAKLRTTLLTKFPVLFLTKPHGDTFHLQVSGDLLRVQG